MRLESVAKFHSPKSPMMSDSPRATASDSLSGTDVMAAMGMAQSQAGFGMAAFCGKHELSQNDKQKAINYLMQFAHKVSGKYRGVAKLEGNTKAKVLQVLATFAYADYCRSAATPGARCRDCHGTGRAVDIAKTEQWGRVVEKECGRCKGVGYSRMPASAAYRAVTMLIPNLTPAGYTQPAVMNQALAALLQQTSADIQEVTGGSQAMQQMPSNIAQETVNNLMNRADMASFIYLDNMAKSLKRAGEVWLSMAREVYGSEREVRIVNEDGSDDIAVLSAQVVDRQTGAVVALNDLSVGRYDVTVDIGPSYTARRDATVSVLTNVLSSMLPTDPMRPAIQGIILDNIDGEGLDDFKEYNRNQLLISGIAKPRNEKEQQIVQQAQMAAQSQPNPEMVLAQAQMVAAQAEAQKATNETAQTQIKAFTAQQDAMESQANTVYKLAQARNIDDKAVMEAIRLLKDVAESQQQQFQSPPQSPADLMPS
ncbi:hypothetical protein FD842_08860 [Escherichia coli]|nr:hypothetical protein [Escherichia coli]